MSGIIPAKRTKEIRYAVRDITVFSDKVAREKPDLEMLKLNIGDPNKFDFVTPRHLVEAMCRALEKNCNGYAPSSGIPQAVEAVRWEATEKKGIRNIQDVFITTGASEAIELCLSALVNAGENVLTPAPGYPLYTAIIAKLEAVENPYYLDEANGWQPDIEDVKRKVNDKTRAIVLINPNNPTGANCSRQTLLDLIAFAKSRNIVLFSDEIYDKQLFDGEKQIATASLDSEAPIITFGGLSKNYLGPGLRIGWGILSGNEANLADLKEAVNKQLRARLCANHPLQYAVEPALKGDQSHLTEMMAKLTRRRDLTVEMLNAIDGVSCVSPKGAFYAFPKVEIEEDDDFFVRRLIEETGVVVVPGSGFGQVPGTKHFRVVFLPQEEVLEKAYRAIGEFMKKYRHGAFRRN